MLAAGIIRKLLKLNINVFICRCLFFQLCWHMERGLYSDWDGHWKASLEPAIPTRGILWIVFWNSVWSALWISTKIMGFQVAALFHIGTTKSHPPIPDHLSSGAKDFLLKCLQKYAPFNFLLLSFYNIDMQELIILNTFVLILGWDDFYYSFACVCKRVECKSEML